MTPTEAFAKDIQRYGERINAAPGNLPGVEGVGEDGWRVEVSGDPLEYRLIGNDAGQPRLMIASPDRTVVLEEIFRQLTFHMTFGPLTAQWDGTQETADRLRREAEPEQERLMAQLDPQWGERQRARNAAFWVNRAGQG